MQTTASLWELLCRDFEACTEMRAFLKAESFHMQTLAIREKGFGTVRPEVAQTMANLAVVDRAAGNPQKALAFCSGALKIYRRFRGADDPEMRTVTTNRDALFSRIGYQMS